MTIKVAHIYACRATFNSGDYMIGISTKIYFKQNILKKDDVKFCDFDCRNKSLFSANNIKQLNNFDHIIVGGGGLILPDTSPNKISCWQWIIKKDNYKLITKPIYVIAVGYNLFYNNHNMNMPNRQNNYEDKERLPIFKKNITELIKRSKYFSLRHNNDVKILNDILNNKFISKIKYLMCPSVWYVQNYWKSKINKHKRKYIAIEIKDDRQWRRYYKIGKWNFYNELKQFVLYCLRKNIPILYLSHDGSKDFYKYLKKEKIEIQFMTNSKKKEKDVLENYSKIHTILCSAGHSQMISYGLGIRIISLISHPKLKYFCEDVKNNEGIDINQEKDVYKRILQILEKSE